MRRYNGAPSACDAAVRHKEALSARAATGGLKADRNRVLMPRDYLLANLRGSPATAMTFAEVALLTRSRHDL